jgi:hypothetical protein
MASVSTGETTSAKQIKDAFLERANMVEWDRTPSEWKPKPANESSLCPDTVERPLTKMESTRTGVRIRSHLPE